MTAGESARMQIGIQREAEYETNSSTIGEFFQRRDAPEAAFGLADRGFAEIP